MYYVSVHFCQRLREKSFCVFLRGEVWKGLPWVSFFKIRWTCWTLPKGPRRKFNVSEKRKLSAFISRPPSPSKRKFAVTLKTDYREYNLFKSHKNRFLDKILLQLYEFTQKKSKSPTLDKKYDNAAKSPSPLWQKFLFFGDIELLTWSLTCTKSPSTNRISHKETSQSLWWVFSSYLRVNKGCALAICFQVRSLYVAGVPSH